MRPRLGAVVKFAVFSDIHGNLPALEATLAGLPSVDAILCCGDIVGYYPDVNEVCEQLQENGVRAIRGNHDAYVVGLLQPDPEKRPIYYTDWTRAHLSEHSFQWLASLSAEMQISADDFSLLVRHASPWDEETYIYANSPSLAKISLKKNEILILGHTHHPMLIRAGEGFLLNPGSVGQPRDWNPMAGYALIDTESGRIEHRRIDYDFKQFQMRLKSMNWNQDLIEVLGRTRG